VAFKQRSFYSAAVLYFEKNGPMREVSDDALFGI
jgi:hypothetical protein